MFFFRWKKGNFRCSSPALSGNPYEPIEYGYENGQNILHNNNNNNTGQSSYYMPNVNSTRANLQSASSTSNREQQQQQRILPKGGRNRVSFLLINYDSILLNIFFLFQKF